MSLLTVRGLAVSYGGVKAVKGIDMEVGRGELVCLIGANGAGKTTTLKALVGLLPSASGSVHYAGQDISKRPAHAIARAGLALVPEGRGIFSRMRVAENLDMGAYARNDKAAIKRDLERVYTLFPRLAERRTQLAGTLSGGEQQMLAMGRAMMSRPNVLLLDEPSMGLAPLMVERIFETIQTISGDGVTILLVEQNAKRALEISQRGYVMENGVIALADDAAKLLRDARVRKAYLGEAE